MVWKYASTNANVTTNPDTGMTNLPRNPSMPNLSMESFPSYLNPSGKKLTVVPGEIPNVKPLSRNSRDMN